MTRTCPSCGYANDASTAISDGAVKPGEGDISICLECTEVSFFKGEKLELAGDALVGLHPETLSEIFKVQAAIKRMKASAA